MKYGMHLSPPVSDIQSFLENSDLQAVQTMSFDDKIYPVGMLEDYFDFLKEKRIEIVFHAPLAMNLISNKGGTRFFSYNLLVEECRRCNKFGVDYMVFHPGSLYPGDKIIALVDSLKKVKTLVVRAGYHIPANFAVETMCGSGSQSMVIPEDYIHLKELCDLPQLSLCIDTAHIYGGGYTPIEFVKSLYEAHLLDTLRVIHFNNTLSIKGSNKERHALLEEGKLTLGDFEELLIFLKEYMSDEAMSKLLLLEEPPKGVNLVLEEKVMKNFLSVLIK